MAVVACLPEGTSLCMQEIDDIVEHAVSLSASTIHEEWGSWALVFKF